ncbi:hypothetical protein [Chitinimonas sp. BJYL2]|uniref:hypothetical protein n=1 Tax=Chitinimonas sp. BJYL2 TaxID=2976696 RepID=UPI0022B52846|nr:hypothetical protein [Chitinimonas sp. BJYL2]
MAPQTLTSTPQPQRFPDLPDVLGALESGRLAAHAFDHRAHVFSAWAAMYQFGTKVGAERFRYALKAYVRHLGAEDKFHVTITEALLRLIAEQMPEAQTDADRWQRAWRRFELRAAPLLESSKSALAPYYSAALLALPAARTCFIEPDLAPLPPWPVQSNPLEICHA